MGWITLTEANIATYQAGRLVEAMKTKAKADGQENPVADAIRVVVSKMRSAIKNGGYCVDADESKIPPELERDALALIVAVAKPRLSLDLKSDEREANQKALELLDRIASGDFAPSMPDNPVSPSETTQTSGSCRLVRPARGAPQRSDYNGF